MSTKRTIDFKTSATLLRNLFPNSHYSFIKPDTIATASFTVETLSNMAWLGGGGYDLLAFYIHEVRVTDSNGKMRRGIYCPLMLENLTDPIITGREELGIPKLYSDINIEESATHCSVKIGWRGNTFANFSWKNLTKIEKGHTLTPPEAPDSEGLLLHKYMPSHQIGKSICENDILLPDKGEKLLRFSHKGCLSLSKQNSRSRTWGWKFYRPYTTSFLDLLNFLFLRFWEGLWLSLLAWRISRRLKCWISWFCSCCRYPIKLISKRCTCSPNLLRPKKR